MILYCSWVSAFSLLHSTRLEGVRLPPGGKIRLEKERRRGGLHEESVRTATRRKRKKNSWVEEARVLAAHFIGPAHLVPLVEVRWQRRPSSRGERNDPRSRGSRSRKFANISGRGSKKGAHLKVTIGNSQLFSPCAVSFGPEYCTAHVNRCARRRRPLRGSAKRW